VNAQDVVRDVLPDIHLKIATEAPEGLVKEGEIFDEWPIGWYGLVEINNPIVVFPPLPDQDTPEWNEFIQEMDYELFDVNDYGYNWAKLEESVGYVLGDPQGYTNWLFRRISEKIAASS
jgi:hypothetical protein